MPQPVSASVIPGNNFTFHSKRRRVKTAAFFNVRDKVIQFLGAIGGFNDNARGLLNSEGYMQSKDVADYIFSTYVGNSFERQEEAGPIIAKLPTLKGRHVGIFFHTKPFNTLEIFYEAKDEALTKLPDVFVSDDYCFYTIKAVENIDDNPVLKARKMELL